MSCLATTSLFLNEILQNSHSKYSMFSIISTCSIKRTGLPNFQTSLLNVPYDLKKGQEQINVLVSIKRTGFKSSYTLFAFLSKSCSIKMKGEWNKTDYIWKQFLTSRRLIKRWRNQKMCQQKRSYVTILQIFPQKDIRTGFYYTYWFWFFQNLSIKRTVRSQKWSP